jgi:hypothetical protein
MVMVTTSGDVPVPVGARWAAVTAAGGGATETGAGVGGAGQAQPGEARRVIVDVMNRTSIHVEVGADDLGDDGIVMIEWLFDADNVDAH